MLILPYNNINYTACNTARFGNPPNRFERNYDTSSASWYTAYTSTTNYQTCPVTFYATYLPSNGSDFWIGTGHFYPA